jgi:hypothetical protein
MSDDLVKALREVRGNKLDYTNTPNHLRLTAADRIEQLAATNEKLEAKLEKLIAGAETVLEEWDRGAEAAFREAVEEMRADVAEAKGDRP